MITGRIKKWGNSIGLLIPKEDAVHLDLRENQEVAVEITTKENPLKELFGFGKDNKITRKAVEETRKLPESKWV